MRKFQTSIGVFFFELKSVGIFSVKVHSFLNQCCAQSSFYVASYPDTNSPNDSCHFNKMKIEQTLF